MSADAETDYAGDAYRACLHGKADRQQQQSAAAQISGLHGVKGELIDALRHARHALVCCCGLRATDLTEERIAELMALGRPRSSLEFTVDSGREIGLIDALLARAEASS